jgi:hypothetical protein
MHPMPAGPAQGDVLHEKQAKHAIFLRAVDNFRAFYMAYKYKRSPSHIGVVLPIWA